MDVRGDFGVFPGWFQLMHSFHTDSTGTGTEVSPDEWKSLHKLRPTHLTAR